MSRPSKILVATDFSPNASLALDRATELAKRHGAKLLLLHAVTSPPLLGTGLEPSPLPPNYLQELTGACSKELSRLADQVRGEGVEVIELLENAHPAEAIVAAAQSEHADLIVAGTRGHTGFEHLVLGSVAEEIVRTAHCPVLVVHPSDADPLAEIDQVLIPTDFSEDAQAALEAVLDLLGGQGKKARLELLYASHIPALLAPMVGPSLLTSPPLVDDLQKLARERLGALAKELEGRGFEVGTHAHEGDPATIITRVAGTLGVDLIAMGTRGLSKLKKLMLGSAAQRVVAHAPCPVLTVRRSDADK